MKIIADEGIKYIVATNQPTYRDLDRRLMDKTCWAVVERDRYNQLKDGRNELVVYGIKLKYK